MALTEEEIKNREQFGTKVLAGLEGLTSIAGTTGNLMRLGDIGQYQSAINSIDNIGRNYSTYDQIAQGYSDIAAPQPNINYDTVRGRDSGEQFGDILSSTVSGATAGTTIGGALGGVVGGVFGLGAGLFGKYTGDAAARNKTEALKLDALVATNHAQQNLQASSEYLTDQTHRQRIANLNATGGKMERKMLTAKEFADKVLGRQRQRPVTNSSGLVIKKCDGGTMIRIKR